MGIGSRASACVTTKFKRAWRRPRFPTAGTARRASGCALTECSYALSHPNALAKGTLGWRWLGSVAAANEGRHDSAVRIYEGKAWILVWILMALWMVASRFYQEFVPWAICCVRIALKAWSHTQFSAIATIFPATFYPHVKMARLSSARSVGSARIWQRPTSVSGSWDTGIQKIK